MPSRLPDRSGQRRLTDHLRPRYHVLPAQGWLNDPNGLLRVDGRFHVFYQHNPDEAVWRNIHWGHASSSDLVHWEHEPIALHPEPGGPDADGCWSGSAIIGPDGPIAFYTGRQGDEETVCIAHWDASLREFRKDPRNPALRPPATPAVSDFRDPRVWREGSGWRMVVGAGLETGPGAILQFQSTDLYQWEAMGSIVEGAHADRAEVWECPDLFAIDGRHALIYSVTPGAESTRYATGTWDGRRFRAVVPGFVDLGPYFYAAQTLADTADRRLAWGWIREGRTVAAQRAAGWSGALSLPRSLAVDPAGRLHSRPVPELRALRGDRYHLANIELGAGKDHRLGPDLGHAWEGLLRFSAGSGASLRLVVCASADGGERTVVNCESGSRSVTLDRTSSSLSGEVDRDRRTFELPEHARTERTPTAEITEVHVFVDGSIIEVFIDGSSITTRVYPTDPESTGVHLEAVGGHVVLHSAEFWVLGDATRRR